MNCWHVFPVLQKAVGAGVCLLALCAVAAAQSADPEARILRPGTPEGKIIPLVSDACPTVRPGDEVTLDWYPGFDIPGIVTGMRSFRLTFARVSNDGYTLEETRSPLVLGGRSGGYRATSAWNGFFHIELSISRSVREGVYHLVGAEGYASATDDYTGPRMEMRNSPVDGRYCMTVVKPPPTPQQQSTSEGPQ